MRMLEAIVVVATPPFQPCLGRRSAASSCGDCGCDEDCCCCDGCGCCCDDCGCDDGGCCQCGCC